MVDDLKIDREMDSEPTAGARRSGPGRPRSTTKPTAKTPIVPKTLPRKTIVDALTGHIGMVGMTVLSLDKHYERKVDGSVERVISPCGMAIIEQGPSIAEALADAAEKNPAVRKVVNMLVTTGTFGELAVALFPVAQVILANHIPMLAGSGIDAVNVGA